ncbi:DNA replication/repair protein RecF [Bartonella sp. LJL80]
MNALDGQAQRVVVRQLQLTNYRNYNSFALGFSGQHVVFTGHNGAGKTNLLEALSFLSPGRGLRRAAYNDIPASMRSDGGFVVFAHLQSALYGDVNIGTALEAGEGGRKIRIDGTNTPADRLAEYCRVSWLIPAMDGLFTGSAADRRRFLDRMVLAIDPAHARRVMDFEKLMRSRNRLLLEGSRDGSWFDALEVQMAELATAIAAARLDVVRLLEEMGAAYTADSTFPRAALSVDGLLEQSLTIRSAIDVEEDYMQRLRNGRELDRATGRTMEGPHRSDLQVIYADKNMAAALCSTGEQKALLTGLILSHAQVTAKVSGMAPILLLDEMAAHLDHRRRAALFDILDDLGGQAFMTGTDRALFNALEGRAEFFEIADGALFSM